MSKWTMGNRDISVRLRPGGDVELQVADRHEILSRHEALDLSSLLLTAAASAGAFRVGDGRMEDSPPRPPGYGRCPRCRSVDPPGSARERRPDGNTTCGACGRSSPSREWSL